MPVSGQEELGANTVARRSSDFLMGVPIKKRKFPYIRPSSPPPQIPPTVSNPVPQQEELPNLKSELSSLTADSAIVVSKSDSIIPSPSQEENGERSANRGNVLVQSNDICPEVDLHELTTETKPCSGLEICTKSTTLIVSKDTAFEKIVRSSELQLAPNNDHKQKAEEDMSKREPSKNDKLNLLEKSVNGGTFPDLAVQGSAGIAEEEKLDPCSWNLSLTERQSSSGISCSTEKKMNCGRLETNRTHWDLNTMMDTWEGSMCHSAALHPVGGDDKGVVHPNKLAISKSEDPHVASGTLELSEDKSKLSTFSAPQISQAKNDIILHLTLSTSSGLQTNISPEPSSTSSLKVDARSDLSNNLSLSKSMSSPSSNMNLSSLKIVKSEPSEESSKHFHGVNHLKPVEDRIVKAEPCVGCFQDDGKTSTIGNLKLKTNGSVKSESVPGVNQDDANSKDSEFYTCNPVLPLRSQVSPVSDPICTVALPVTSRPSSCPTSLGLSYTAEASNRFENTTSTIGSPCGEEARKITQTSGASVSDSISESFCTDSKKSEVAGDMPCISRAERLNFAGPEFSRGKPRDKLQPDSHGISDVTGSDDERLNIFDDMHDDCSSDTDEESEGNHGAGNVFDSENNHYFGDDDDYEDGEVREPLVHSATEVGACAENEIDHGYHGIIDNREVGPSDCPADITLTCSVHVEDKGMRLEDANIIMSSSGIEDLAELSSKPDNCSSRPACLLEAPAVEVSTVETVKMESIKAAHRGLVTVREDGHSGCEDLLPAGIVSSSQGIFPGQNQGSAVSRENIYESKLEETKYPVWSKTESFVVGAEGTKDVNGKGNQSRIINLARAFSGPSPGRMRSFPGRFLPSRIERERFNDGMRNLDKLHPRGTRDDGPIDCRNKFERQRNQDQPVAGDVSDFMHGRGRPEKRYDSPHAAVMVARDGPVVGSGRKPMNDELPSFRHVPSRRRSPGGRGRPLSHGVQIVRRSARDISPDRCIGRGDPSLIGLREKKFMRGLQDDMLDTVFSRTQHQYQQVDDHFIRGERSFSPIQRKGPLQHIPRIRSRSPSRTRSPGNWSSPRRRSPDGFGRQEMLHRRSPPFYRMKRMRSPHQRPVFADDIEGRRHGSPPYISRVSNDMREMGASRDPEHPRSFISNRSPSGRILPRGTRRFDMMDPRERIENDEYFSGPIRSDRFHEIGGDGGAEGRRICPERRRSFRPPYDDTEVEKFHFHVEGGPRSYRFSPEPDAEFHERGNLRDREFDRRVKNRTGNAPRRTRSVEDHEENFRQGEEEWHGSGFEDVSPGKRRRF